MSLDISREEQDLEIKICREKALAGFAPLYITILKHLPVENGRDRRKYDKLICNDRQSVAGMEGEVQGGPAIQVSGK
jgi:hypothetical protein